MLNLLDPLNLSSEIFSNVPFGYPTTVPPTTVPPTTVPPTTASPTTASPTTASPTTASPTTTPEPCPDAPSLTVCVLKVPSGLAGDNGFSQTEPNYTDDEYGEVTISGVLRTEPTTPITPDDCFWDWEDLTVGFSFTYKVNRSTDLATSVAVAKTELQNYIDGYNGSTGAGSTRFADIGGCRRGSCPSPKQYCKYRVYNKIEFEYDDKGNPVMDPAFGPGSGVQKRKLLFGRNAYAVDEVGRSTSTTTTTDNGGSKVIIEFGAGGAGNTLGVYYCDSNLVGGDFNSFMDGQLKTANNGAFSAVASNSTQATQEALDTGVYIFDECGGGEVDRYIDAVLAKIKSVKDRRVKDLRDWKPGYEPFKDGNKGYGTSGWGSGPGQFPGGPFK